MTDLIQRAKHHARGSEYTILSFNPLFQCSAQPSLDHKPLILYRGDDGHWFARLYEEFMDGRFAVYETNTNADRPTAMEVLGCALNLDRYNNHLMGDACEDRVDAAITYLFRLSGRLMEGESDEGDLEKAIMDVSPHIMAALGDRVPKSKRELARNAWTQLLTKVSGIRMERQRHIPLTGGGS